MAENGTERLESWKEIATFIGRDERTAMRWAKRGMPVRRDPAEKRGRVFAYRTEVARWMEGRSSAAVEQSPDATGPSASAVETPAQVVTPRSPQAAALQGRYPGNEHSSKTWPERRGLLIFFACAVVMAGIATLATLSPVKSAAAALNLRRLTDDGRAKTGLLSDGSTLYFNERDGQRIVPMSVPIQGGTPVRLSTPFENTYIQDVSEDGGDLLVGGHAGINREHRLWVMSVFGGAPRSLGEVSCDLARWAPDQRAVACVNPGGVSLLAPDGSLIQTTESLAHEVGHLAWSPNGECLRFTLVDGPSGHFSAWELPIHNNKIEGRPFRLPLGPDCCSAIAWTFSGRDFLFAGTDEKQDSHLAAVPETNGRPPLSEIRTEIPLMIGRVEQIIPGKNDHDFYMLVSNTDRGELVKFSPQDKAFGVFLPGLSATYVSFSRDGQWVSYLNTTDDSLWRSRTDGTHAVQMTKPPVQVELSAWSPDGKQIAFMAKQPGRPWRIFVVGRDSGSPREAAAGTDNQGAPTWSPDGKSLAYANVICSPGQPCEIRRIDLASGSTETVQGSQGYRTARWSPDGKYITALQPDRRELALFDMQTGSRKTLASSVTGDDIHWSFDSRDIYFSSPFAEKPVIDRIHLADGRRETIADLDSLRRMPGSFDMWFGLAPDGSPIFFHHVTAEEVYALGWARK